MSNAIKQCEGDQFPRFTRSSADNSVAMAYWRCPICITFLCLTIRILLNHTYVSHSAHPNFHVACVVDGCSRTYNRYHSFYKHVTTVHREHYGHNDGNGNEVGDIANIQNAGVEGNEGFNHEINNADVTDLEVKLQNVLHVNGLY